MGYSEQFAIHERNPIKCTFQMVPSQLSYHFPLSFLASMFTFTLSNSANNSSHCLFSSHNSSNLGWINPLVCNLCFPSTLCKSGVSSRSLSGLPSSLHLHLTFCYDVKHSWGNKKGVKPIVSFSSWNEFDPWYESVTPWSNDCYQWMRPSSTKGYLRRTSIIWSFIWKGTV